jgi:hypothetical protein
LIFPVVPFEKAKRLRRMAELSEVPLGTKSRVRALSSPTDRQPMLMDVPYLREQAHYCVALARECPHLATSQALEALGVELMEKAAELERDGSFTALDSDARAAMRT